MAAVLPATSAERHSRRGGSTVRLVAAVTASVLMALVILGFRGWGPFAESASATATRPTVPTSREFEQVYGVRLLSVDITAAGGMIQLRYQVLDGDKAQAIHAAEGEPAVVTVIDSAGHEYSDPGIAGHSHVAPVYANGNHDTILLANARGGVSPGDTVTIRIGDQELTGVPVD